MFWLNNKKSKKDKRQNTGNGSQGDSHSVGTSNGQRGNKASGDIRAQALANARNARENLGDDTVQRIAEIMAKKEHSTMAKAQAQIADADPDKVLDELKWMLDGKA